MKRKNILIMLGIAIIALIVTGITYAYYSANIKKINQTQTVIKTNELGLIYTGISEITAEGMIPGDSFEKTFSVENTSNVAVSYNIYMEEILNEFNEDLVYTLSDENGEVISETRLPVTNNEKSYLKTNITIEAKAIQNYTLTITYKYLETPQNENQGSIFSATVGIDTKQIKEELPIGGTLRACFDNSISGKAFWDYKGSITKVVFEPTLQPKENAAYTFDVSEGQDQSIMSYLIANEEDATTYTLYIQTDGKVMANENSRDLFAGFFKLTTIEGLEYFDTRNATDMSYMFSDCFRLKNLDVSHFDTSNVTAMSYMFYYCADLTSLDLSHFDTSNVTMMNYMFAQCTKLINLDVSHFDTSYVTVMWRIFKNCNSLTNLDISSFTIDSLENELENRELFSENMLDTIIIKVKDREIQTWILNGTLRPSSWSKLNVVFDGDVITNTCNTSITSSNGPTAGYEIYYSEYVAYNNGTYTLINPQLFTVGSDTTTLIGKYSTFNSTSTTSSGNIFYITELKSDGSIATFNVATNGECAN